VYVSVFHVKPPQMGLSQMLYHEAMMGHQHHPPPPPACSSVTFVDNREKIKQWIAEQGETPRVFPSRLQAVNMCCAALVRINCLDCA